MDSFFNYGASAVAEVSEVPKENPHYAETKQEDLLKALGINDEPPEPENRPATNWWGSRRTSGAMEEGDAQSNLIEHQEISDHHPKPPDASNTPAGNTIDEEEEEDLMSILDAVAPPPPDSSPSFFSMTPPSPSISPVVRRKMFNDAKLN